MKHYSTLLKASLLLMGAAACLPTQAAWEKVFAHPTTQAHFITSQGNFLLSDFDDNRDGGIFISEDKGATWTKTDVKDFNYHKFYEADGYVYALGYSARIARSSDGGRTWDVLNYTNALKDVVNGKDIEALVAYGIVKVDDRLYISDFAGGGVLYSTDNGESWQLTDRQSLLINLQGQGEMMDSFYNLVDFNGHIYAFGALSVHRYDAGSDSWELLDLNSNFMSVSTIFDGRLVCGRAVTDMNPETDYLVWTADGYEWHGINAPEPLNEFGISRNVRAIHSDDKYIYTTGPDGVAENPDPSGAPYVNAPEFFFTSDFGETWSNSAGLPVLTYPLTVTSDDDYIYVALYSPFPTNADSGLWRISKDELTSGVDSVKADGNMSVSFSGSEMVLPETALRVSIYTLDGRLVESADHVTRVSLGSLGRGVYLYEVAFADANVTGKFIK